MTRYTPEAMGITKLDNYESASILLDYILARIKPEPHILKDVYNGNSDIMSDHIQRFYDESARPAGIIRISNPNAPTEISDKRSEINNDKDFQKIQFSLTKSQLPEKKLFYKFFGKYTDNNYDIKRMFIEQNKLRKCGISSTTHHFRAAGVMYALLDKNDPDFFKIVASMDEHDTIEELLYSTMIPGKSIYYGLAGYDEFVDRYIHPDLQDLVKMMTNHYDMIIQYVDNVLETQDKRFTKENLLKFFEASESHGKGWSASLDKYVNNLLLRLDGANRDPEWQELDSNMNYFENIKWKAYKGLYIPNMAIECLNPKPVLGTTPKPNYIPLEEKGAGDISDNFHGKGDLEIYSRINIALKQHILADVIKNLHTDWTPLNNHAAEMMQNSYIYARYLIVRDFLEQQSPQDYFESAMKKLKRLEPILYDKTV